MFVVGAIIILLISYFTLIKPKANNNDLVPTPTVAEVYPTISSDIKVDLSSKNDNKAIVLRISNIPQGVESIDYEISYLTGDGLPRGVVGTIKIAQEKEIIRDDIVLGTCSSGSCVYDKGVREVDLSLKFNSRAGASVFRNSYPL